jgi:hypothetical protein
MGGDPLSAWAAEGIRGAADERACWPHFTLALNLGLEPFRAHVEHPAPLSDGDEFTLGLPQVGLYSAACRQTFNSSFTVRRRGAARARPVATRSRSRS